MLRILKRLAWCAAVAAALTIAWAAPALAQSADPVTLETVIGNITQWVLGLLFGVATLFLAIAGLRYAAAGGDPMQIEKAKSALRSALIGYALALLSRCCWALLKAGWGSEPDCR